MPPLNEGAAFEAAPAKVNLWLHVLGRRADGYHALDSLIVFADFGERVSAAAATVDTLEITGPEGAALRDEATRAPNAPNAPGRNLVLRAAENFRSRFGGGHWAFTLEKHIPVAAGLGGGSADAAATLRLLARLHEIDPADPALASIAGELGADVPVCLASRSSLVGGIGERLAPAEGLDGHWLVIVNPRVALPTTEVFRALDADPVGIDAPAPEAMRLTPAAWRARIATARNDLAPPAMARAPVVTEAIDLIAGTAKCLAARMTGSGASVFGLYAGEDDARTARDRIATAQPDWWARAAQIASHDFI